MINTFRNNGKQIKKTNYLYKKYINNITPPFIHHAYILLAISISNIRSSRPVCPATEVFSSARRIKYGSTSLTEAYGTYLVTLYPAWAKLKEILSLIPNSCAKKTRESSRAIPFSSINFANL